MLEAQCSLQPDSKDGVYLHGDIIVVALPGHPWGTRDQIDLLVAQWQDDALELLLVTRRKDGEDWPVISYPYAEWDIPDPERPNRRILVHQSTQTVDVDSLSKTDAALVSDMTVATPILSADAYAVRDDTVVDNLIVRSLKSIGSFITSMWSKVVG